MLMKMDMKLKKWICKQLFMKVLFVFFVFSFCTFEMKVYANGRPISYIEESKRKTKIATVGVESLNVRVEPGIHETIKGSLFRGDRVLVYMDSERNASGYAWVKIRRISDDFEGWVAKKYLK